MAKLLAWYVDDDQEMIQAITMMARLLDIEIRPFQSAQSIAKSLTADPLPNLLFLDINMPQVTGIDLLEFIRRDSSYDRLPIVMLSSEDTDIQVQEALDKGADAYAMKPVTIDELETAINAAIAKRSAT